MQCYVWLLHHAVPDSQDPILSYLNAMADRGGPTMYQEYPLFLAKKNYIYSIYHVYEGENKKETE